MQRSRREFVRNLGIGAAALPFVLNLPTLGFANQQKRKQRLVVMFSPNGVVSPSFWPDEEGANFTLKDTLKPIEPFKDRTLILQGVCDYARGEGDAHMRGMGGLLTGIELAAGNIQGSGVGPPAGWAKGISIDQELKNYLQKDAATRTRFGSLEFGVMVLERADPWTRMIYAGANKPIAPIDDPYQMFNKLYGRLKYRETLKSVLDDVKDDLKKVGSMVSAEDRRLLEEHAAFVREKELELQSAKDDVGIAAPRLEPGIKKENDKMPVIGKMQMDLLVNSFVADFCRVATLQFTNSRSNAVLRWLGVDGKHHELSHKPDSDSDVQRDLAKIDKWYCEQFAYLLKRLAETPEPGGPGSLLDNTLVVWANELGKGNSHSLDDIPFVLVGNGLGFKMGRSLKYQRVPHNRLLLALAHGFGHRLDRFGNPSYGKGVPLDLS